MRKSIIGGAAVAALLLALALAGCGGSSTPAPGGSTSGGTPATAVQVVLQNIAIQPANVTVAVGGTVTWVNKDSMTHVLTDDGGTWGSGQLVPGKSYSYKFTKAGTFPYHCTIHPSMTGQVTVK